MIFCFSQRNNTQYAAQRLAQATGDYTVSIWEYPPNETMSSPDLSKVRK